jgi:CRISPR-associated protein Csm2
MGLNSENYVDEAEKVIRSMVVKDRNGNDRISVTTSKIRNILSMVTELYDDVIHEPGEELSKEIVERIQYLRLRIAYEAGRDPSVREFVDKSKLLSHVKQIGNKKKTFLLFCRYVEALVAYHRYCGGEN